MHWPHSILVQPGFWITLSLCASTTAGPAGMDVSSWCSVQVSQLNVNSVCLGPGLLCVHATFCCTQRVCAHAEADKCFDIIGKCVRSVASMSLKRAKTEDQTRCMHACMHAWCTNCTQRACCQD